MMGLKLLETLGVACSSVVILFLNLFLASGIIIVIGLLTLYMLKIKNASLQSLLLRATLIGVVLSPLVIIVFEVSGIRLWSFQLPQPVIQDTEPEMGKHGLGTSGKPYADSQSDTIENENVLTTNDNINGSYLQQNTPDIATVKIDFIAVLYGCLVLLWLSGSAFLLGRLLLRHLYIFRVRKYAVFHAIN